VVTVDVGGQGDVPQPVDRLVGRPGPLGFERDDTPAEEEPTVHGGPDAHAGSAIGILEHEPRARLELLSRVHERLPAPVIEALEEQAFGRAAAWIAPADEPRRKNPGVVADDAVTGLEERRQVVHRDLAKRRIATRDQQHARAAARPGLLRDELIGQVEVEIGNQLRPLHSRPRSIKVEMKAYARMIPRMTGTRMTKPKSAATAVTKT